MTDPVCQWATWVLRRLGAGELSQATLIQNLWGGYGELLRVHLRDGPVPSAILKRMAPPSQAGESASDRRKRRSYEVEWAWYLGGSRRCHQGCRVATCYAAEQWPSGGLLLLEDLGNAGFTPSRPPGPQQLRAGLRWLASFHSCFLQDRPGGLWEQGTYWHLATRQDEWRRMPAGPLRQAAASLDQRLREARFQTLVHGDAKPSNFCWRADERAAAVDFQYVGPGCGIRDVAYFLDCCLDESGCVGQADEYLDFYFNELGTAMSADGNAGLREEVEAEWRALFPVAWTDFQRFYQGWGRPGPLGPYSREMLSLALQSSAFDPG